MRGAGCFLEAVFIERARGTGLVCARVLEISLFVLKKRAPASQAIIILLLRNLTGCSGECLIEKRRNENSAISYLVQNCLHECPTYPPPTVAHTLLSMSMDGIEA